MSLSREQMIELMALADGELEGEEKDRAEALVRSSEEARRVLESFTSPARADALREAMDVREAGASAAHIAEGVMQSLGVREGAPPSKGVRRVQGASRRLRVVLGSSGVIALAAGIALYVHGVPATSPGGTLEGARAGAAPREALPTGPASDSAEPAIAPTTDGATANGEAEGPTAAIEVIAIYATHSDAGVWHDARLHGAELDRPPLSAFERLRMVDRRMLHLPAGRRAFETLASGHALAVTLVTATGGADPRSVVHVAWTEAGPSIDAPGAHRLLEVGAPPADLTLKPGEPVVLEDEPSDTGAFFVELIARP